MAEKLATDAKGGLDLPRGVEPVFFDSGIEVKPVYTAADANGANGAGEERPGEYPFTRGIHAEMYRRRPWTMRQYTGFGNAQATNERFHYLIETGNTGLNVAFDLPSQCGLDSDDPAAEGEVGRVGMAVDSLRDFEVAFDGVDLNAITVSLTINGAAAIMIAMYLAMAEKRGYDIAALRGTAQNDILKEMVGRGTWVFPVEPSVRLVGDTIEYCARHAPNYSPVSVCGYHIRESGCDPAEEMAYAFEIAKAYIDETLRRGLAIDDFAGRLSFNFNVFGKLFEEVAKFRAGRRMWAKILKEQYGAKNRQDHVDAHDRGRRRLRAHHRPAGEQHHARRLLRALRRAVRRPDDRAVLLRRGLHDPLAQGAADLDPHHAIADRGTRPVRHGRSARRLLFRRGADRRDGRRRSTAAMRRVQDEGGIVAGVASGRIQDRVSQQAYEHHRRIESGAARKVGVNCYRVEEEKPDVAFHPERQEDVDMQMASLKQVRAERSRDAVDRALKRLHADAAGGANTMPAIMEAVKAYATVGEMTKVLADVYGRFEEPVTI